MKGLFWLTTSFFLAFVACDEPNSWEPGTSGDDGGGGWSDQDGFGGGGGGGGGGSADWFGGDDPNLRTQVVGSGESPWHPGEDNSSGVVVDDSLGGLVLDPANSGRSPFIWVANTGEGSVSKIDVRSFEEVGRYRTGRDPSRTSVNTHGDVYVANRGGMSVVRISNAGAGCPDTNGDGVVTTSSGHDLLALGEDDCVLWQTELRGCGVLRAVAAQDERGPDGQSHPYVWVGGYSGCLWKLDGETGAIVVDRAESPVPTYGFALDGRGNLWIENSGSRALGRVDTTRCVDDASCATEICGDDGDDCVMQRISQPVGGYGITVDSRQRVWIGGSVARYDPSAPAGSRWATPRGIGGLVSFVHGIAADGNGWIWGASMGQVLRFNADDPSQWVRVEGAGGFSAKGAAVDSEGKVWMINLTHNNATVIVPGATIDDAEVMTNVAPVFRSPYTYSDMTGAQLSIATRPPGSYRELLVGCDEGPTTWADLHFDVWAPEGTTVSFSVRTGDDPTTLGDDDWVHLATAPGEGSPVSIGEALDGALVPHGQLLEVELELTAEPSDTEVDPTPVVRELGVSYSCSPEVI